MCVRRGTKRGRSVIVLAAIAAGVGLMTMGANGSPGARLPRVIVGKDGACMVLVPAGQFVMGTAGGRPDEGPAHQRTLPAFYMDQTEVTNAQYAAFVKATGHRPPPHWHNGRPPEGSENWPVTNVDWADAMQYALWAGKRLPTEAEWEKAARGADGRAYPWGDADDPARRELDSDTVGPVGRFPAGASPYGCLDMAGNVWEWTADWYGPYPGSSVRSVHFGNKYKVVRGGGGIYFYGAPNSGRTTERARLAPYARHDALGFRCVKDVDPAKAPYDAARLLDQCVRRLRRALPAPRPLGHETELGRYLAERRVPISVVGPPVRVGHLRAGVPFPRGVLRRQEEVRIIAPSGQAIPVQVAPLLRWGDGSIRWLLMDFPAGSGASYTLEFGLQSPPPTGAPIAIAKTGEGVRIDAGAVELRLNPEELIESLSSGGSRLGPLCLEVSAVSAEGALSLKPGPGGRVEVEESGPLHTVVRLRGALRSHPDTPSTLGYDLRVHAYAGLPEVRLELTLVNRAPRASAPLAIAGARVGFALASAATEHVFGGAGAPHYVRGRAEARLVQADDLGYTVISGGRQVAAGTRAAGWTGARTGQGWVLLGVRHFWQNHPKALLSQAAFIGCELWAGPQPFLWEGGLAKTHELMVAFAEEVPSVVMTDPLRATLPPAWVCGSEAVGKLLPRGPEALAYFPVWEGMRSVGMRRWVRGMPTGMRDYGDAYFGGPYKGKNAYANLEYDIPLNFLLEYLRSGEAWLLEAADAQVRHQADVDIDHHTGAQWKHSPGHTETQADLGHVFVRGLLLHYLLTGDRRSLEAAREVGDWVADEMDHMQGMGNERQIGWGLYALTGLYEVTAEAPYRDVAQRVARKLGEGMSPTGRFNIRWDNRIAFFNGIAMSGLLELYRQTQDPVVAHMVLRLAERTLGFYPEYACRTLNGFAWAAEQTGDARYLDALQRTWESSLEFLAGGDPCTALTHAWQFFPAACRRRLVPPLSDDPSMLPDPATWHVLRLMGDEIELLVSPRGAAEPAVLVLVEGVASGRVEVLDMMGHRLKVVSLPDPAASARGALLRPSAGGITRLRLLSDRPATWQVHTDAQAGITLCDPALANVESLYPTAWGFIRAGTREVKLRLEAMGEGFHFATACDEAGSPLATLRHFVDLGDTGRYERELTVPVQHGQRVIGLELHRIKVLSAEGIGPYWSDDLGALCDPEKGTGR